MNRRALLKRLGAVPFAPLLTTALAERASAGSGLPGMPYPRRVRPNDAAWPDAAAWESLNRQTGGRLIAVTSPFQTCAASPNGAACADALNNIRNPFYVGDQPGLTQTSGWIDAWTSTPSTYAVAAETTADVVAAVNFAREKNLRLVVKGGGHSYQGTSDSGDSLLIWTRKMNAIVLHDAFVPTGCAGVRAPQPAVTIEAGAMWIDAYDAVTTKGGRYVQGRRIARSRDRHRGRHRANRERLHARGLVLGHQRRRRRKPRRRYEAHAANARAAGVFRGRQSYREGELRRRVSQVDRSLRRLLRREFVQRALGRKRPLRPR